MMMKKKVKQAAASFMFVCFALLFAGCATNTTHINRGATAMRSGNYELAIVEFTEAIRLTPSHLIDQKASALSHRGRAYLRNGNLDLAFADFNESIRLNRNSWAHNERGLAFLELGDYDRAVADFQQMVRLFPNHRTAGDNLNLARQLQAAQVAAQRQQPAAPGQIAQAAPGQQQWQNAQTPGQQQPGVQTPVQASVQVTEDDFTVQVNRAGTGLDMLRYTGNATVVNIPSTIQGIPVTDIRSDVFRVPIANRITSVVIPEGIRYIRPGTFAGMRALTSVSLPASLVDIGDHAFYRTSSLTSITIPNGVTRIGSGAFRYSGITSITIPNSVTRIESDAFRRTGITSITIPNSVTYLGGGAFYRTGITSINWPAHLSEIPMSMFRGMRNLQSVTIPEGITVIGHRAFQGTGLTSINLPSTIRRIHLGAFADIPSLTTVNIPDSVTNIQFDGQGSAIWSCAFQGSNISLPTQLRLRQLGYTGRF